MRALQRGCFGARLLQVGHFEAPGGPCVDLYAVPFVATVNNSTANLHLLEVDDWLGNPGNRVVVMSAALARSLFLFFTLFVVVLFFCLKRFGHVCSPVESHASEWVHCISFLA